MKIEKFKKVSKDKYKMFLDNNEIITLYEDVIVNNNLLLKKEIDLKLLDKIKKDNNDFESYILSLNYISTKMRSIKEIKEYLLKKGFNIDIVNKTVNKLIKNNYLDDIKFTKAFINDHINLSTMGPLKIKKELTKYGINTDIIENEISLIDNLIIKEKLNKLLDKKISVKKGSINEIKIKLINYFVNLGYSKEMILELLLNKDISSDKDILKREYNKLLNKYKNKYTGSKLIYFISQKLYSKGYTSDDITSIISSSIR